ncbi:two-component regulator propeller domain-containing protein [Pseudohalocynthiibacter aestuariivivens]|jgi:ligand-binding sensor domain-containing protein|uniref:Two-component regulator propeller domain-containing protein n=1 Tax=Pseudohalocynthiibacter aestuariivivens TaxID=1591409 RepID=A0ABV5JGY2_9RHOB|nr:MULTISPECIES: two-component regulator propeller domain-containing protein [Pseudohalocynthiibacter]MBS9718198.1 hypothetical protein [Pseudohalocynthiibacter aestuariivivens]MCK0103846.1 hypothetical protein [Pseudohalocynthiibacter sp. F2068]
MGNIWGNKKLHNTLRSGLQFFIGAVVVLVGVALIVSLIDLRKINSLPPGWVVLREPGEVSALLTVGDEVWAGGRDGLTIVDRDTLTILATPTEVKGLRYIRALQNSVGGSLWVAHDAGVSQFDYGQWHHFSSGEIGLTGPVYMVLAEPSGNIWVGGEGGLVRFKDGTFEPVMLPEETKITAISTIFLDSSNTLWLGSDSNTNGGLLSFSESSGWQSYSAGQDLNHSSVTDIIEDQTGVLWVTTGFAGRGGVSLFFAK